MSESIPPRPAWLGPAEPLDLAQSRRRAAWACEILRPQRARGCAREDRLRILVHALGHEIAQAPAAQLGATLSWCVALLACSVVAGAQAARDALARLPPQGHG